MISQIGINRKAPPIRAQNSDLTESHRKSAQVSQWSHELLLQLGGRKKQVSHSRLLPHELFYST